MKRLQIIGIIVFITISTMGQNKYPMRISMVSILVEDPVKAFKYYTEILGFEEVMYSPENYIAIVRSPLDTDGVIILLEPTEPEGIAEAKQYKKKLYDMGIPVITFSSDSIFKTVSELKRKGVKFLKDPEITEFGHQAIFDDSNGNYIQLIQLE